MRCPRCNSESIWLDGKSKFGVQRYKCKDCKRSFSGKKREVCKSPSVQNCLNCQYHDCVIMTGFPLDESEIRAEIAAGMVDDNALYMHLLRKQMHWSRRKRAKNGIYR